MDMGSEKMVMALASGEGSVCHLKGIKIMASQGIEHGVIKDKEKVRMWPCRELFCGSSNEE